MVQFECYYSGHQHKDFSKTLLQCRICKNYFNKSDGKMVKFTLNFDNGFDVELKVKEEKILNK